MGELQQSIEARNKEFSIYQKQIAEKFKDLEKRKGGKVPKELFQNLKLINENMGRITAENKDLKKLAREIKLQQLEAISPSAFTGLINRIKVLENKITDFEKSTLHESVEEPTVSTDDFKMLYQKVLNLEKRISVFEEKIFDYQKKVGKEDIAQKREIQSLMSLRSDIEKELTDLKKKISEDTSTQPIILE
jgi:hypothetical protein